MVFGQDLQCYPADMNEQELAKAIASAISQSQTGFKLMDIMGFVGIMLFAVTYIYKNVIEPMRKGGSQSIPDDAKKAIQTVTEIKEMVEDGNAVILSKDQYNQNMLLNIPRWLQDMKNEVVKLVESSTRLGGSIETLVNHQNDIHLEIVNSVREAAKMLEKASANIENLLTKQE